jgi:hypothetical protein
MAEKKVNPFYARSIACRRHHETQSLDLMAFQRLFRTQLCLIPLGELDFSLVSNCLSCEFAPDISGNERTLTI